ncbi:MAG TPA: hypothetical protein VH985_19555 [Candidatus Binatia bacterium]|jgi:hypothetical protein
MRVLGKIGFIILALALFFPAIARSQNLNFKEIESRVSEYRKWLDQLGSNGSRYWIRLDSSKRPHRLFVGDGFMHANATEKEEFVEIFSRFLAGHPDKNMLIDIYDASTGKPIGEYGFGGFRLFDSRPAPLTAK